MAIDPTARETILRVSAERLVEECDDLQMHVWYEKEIDREELRDQASRVVLLACAVLDTLSRPAA